MATFQITGPDGKKYRVTGENAEGALKALQSALPPGGGLNEPKNQHFEFDGSKIPGYNPKTGNVERSKTESALMGAIDMGGLGIADELAAGAITGLEKVGMWPARKTPDREGEGSYSRNLRELRANMNDAQSDNPKSFIGGQVGGGLAQAIATNGASIMPNAQTTLGRVVGGALTGGTYGGLHGFGSGEGIEDRGTKALEEGIIGGATGGMFPIVAKGASSLYQSIANALIGKQAGQQAGVSPEVLRMIGQTLDADGTRGPTGMANMAKAGQDAMLADAGPNARAVLDTAIQRGGPGSVAARDAIAARAGRAGQAVTGALDNTLGQPQGVTAARTAIRQGSAPARGAAYKAAYDSPIDYADPRGMELENLIKTRVPQSAISAANELMRTEGAASRQILAKVADDGTVTFETLPDVRQLDYITRGLNEVADQADGAGKLGGTTARGRAYSNLSSEIRDTLRDLVPDYGKALDTAADPIRRSKAVELGSKLLSSSTTRDQVEEAVSGMTVAEKDAIAQGVRSRLDDLMANVTRTVQDGDTGSREAIKAIKDMSSRANREKLETVLGKAKADALFDEIDRAATSFDLRASVAENSKTFARQATERRVNDMTAPGPIDTALQGKPLNAIQRMAQALTGQTPAAVQSRQDAIYSQMADVLTRGGPAARDIFSAIDDMGPKDKAARLVSESIARALIGPKTSYPSTALLSGSTQEWRGKQ